jgi:hypothetical protein
MQLVKYDAMVNAIAICESADEVKDIRDKAVALEAYAKQANNMEAEHKCALIRVRAERKCGQLLRDTPKAVGAAGNSSNQHQKEVQSIDTTAPKTINEMGISKDQSSSWQKLAAVPEQEFEEAINLPGTKPSANHIIKPKPDPEPIRIDKDALWFWGLVCDLEREGRFERPIAELEAEWTDGMAKASDGLIIKLKKWVNEYD